MFHRLQRNLLNTNFIKFITKRQNTIECFFTSVDRSSINLASFCTSHSKTMSSKKHTQMDGSENRDTTEGVKRSRFTQIINNFGLSQDFNEDKTEVTVHHPGLSMESFNLDGNPCISSLMTILLVSRIYSYHKPIDKSGATYLDYGEMTNDVFTFMVSSEIEIESIMYDSEIIKRALDVKFSLGYIGKTSINSVAEASLSSHGVSLMKNVNQVVLIDKETRRPSPVPEWWKSKYSSHTVRNQPLIISRLKQVEQYYTYKMYVAWTDTDFYNHTTSASYPRFAVNAIQSASSKKVFKKLSGGNLKAGIKKIQMSFIGESAEGDLLEINVWENMDKPIAYCDFRKDDQTIFQCTVQYHIPVEYSDVGI